MTLEELSEKKFIAKGKGKKEYSTTIVKDAVIFQRSDESSPGIRVPLDEVSLFIKTYFIGETNRENIQSKPESKPVELEHIDSGLDSSPKPKRRRAKSKKN